MYDEAQQREIMLDGIDTSGAVQMSQCTLDWLTNSGQFVGGGAPVQCHPLYMHACNDL